MQSARDFICPPPRGGQRGRGNGHKYPPELLRGGALPPTDHLSPLSIFYQNVHPFIELVESSIFFALFAPLSGRQEKIAVPRFLPPLAKFGWPRLPPPLAWGGED